MNQVPKGFERFMWDDFVVSTKPAKKEVKQVEHDGMMLWRKPTPIESQINLKAIQEAFDASEQQLVDDINKLKNKMVHDAVMGIIELDPADYHTLTVQPAKKDLAAFRTELQNIYDKGRELVIGELAEQGAHEYDDEFDISDEDDATLDEITAVTASKIASDVQSRIIGIATTLVVLGIVGSLLKDKILAAIAKLSDAYVNNAAATASHVSLNMGRDASGEANAGIIKEVYYSSVLDRNTCIPCQDTDGQTAENEADLTPCPNPDCEGLGKCRCIHVFVFDTEKKFNPNHDETGRFSSGDNGGPSTSAERSALAKATYNPVTKEKRRTATKYEVEVAKAVGGKFSGDNKPFDVITPTHGIEVKTIFPNKRKPYITMHPESLARKKAAARKEKLKTATIVIDSRTSKPQYYFRAGLGNFSLSTMEAVTAKELRSKLT
jgi:hypothetical protein